MRFDFSAGGVVYKKENGQIKVLLIKPEDKTRPPGWSLPKGHIEKGEKAEAAALREVEEETGVTTEMVSHISDIGYFFKSSKSGELVKKKVSFYLMKYVNGEPTLQKGETSAVQWLEVESALKDMTYKDEKEIAEKAVKIILDS